MLHPFMSKLSSEELAISDTTPLEDIILEFLADLNTVDCLNEAPYWTSKSPLSNDISLIEIGPLDLAC